MHGHKFQIVKRATDYTSDDPTLNPPLVEGQANPIRRDTVQVQSGTSATLRFTADNPGAWFFHCHIEWHLSAGLAITLISAPAEIVSSNKQLPIPSFVADQCAALGMPTSGNAAGHASVTDLAGLPLGPYPQNNGWHPKGIGAMFGCVLTATLGMASVTWYALGGHISEEEMEHEAREHQEARTAGREAEAQRGLRAQAQAGTGLVAFLRDGKRARYEEDDDVREGPSMTLPAVHQLRPRS